MTIAEIIGINLRKILNRRQLSVQWLVDRSGISRRTIYRILGGVLPSQVSIEEICFALNINETELIRID